MSDPVGNDKTAETDLSMLFNLLYFRIFVKRLYEMANIIFIKKIYGRDNVTISDITNFKLNMLLFEGGYPVTQPNICNLPYQRK